MKQVLLFEVVGLRVLDVQYNSLGLYLSEIFSRGIRWQSPARFELKDLASRFGIQKYVNRWNPNATRRQTVDFLPKPLP